MIEGNDPRVTVYEAVVRSQGPEAAFRNLSQMLSESVALEVKRAYELKVGIISRLHRSPTLKDGQISDWYSGPSEDDQFWPALERYLREKKRWPDETIASVDRESTNVMRLLPHVGGKVDAKGLVIGYVQSGKTANYTALIAKAADVGYRLIIVLAGVHNSLRRQTQLRLQAELIDSDPQVKTKWHTLTLPQEDFRARGTNTDAFLTSANHQRILLVVKKNGHVLRRLIKWIKAAQPQLLETCPALILDDEADQAGLNTGKHEDSRTAVNGLILELKKTLPKSAYVGYTATPFANVLVDPSGEDLYPSSFIVALDKPAGYFGAEFFFGREPLEDEEARLPEPPDMFRTVKEDDAALVRPRSRAETANFQPQAPESLRTAIEYFLLATAARWTRGHRMKHSSMLVHTTMSVAVHKRLRNCIQQEVDRIKQSVGDPKTRARLRAVWEDEHEKVRKDGLEPVPFSALEPKLADVLKVVGVVADNSESESRLIYKEESELEDADQVVHIAVGGNTLSRGLTLEGLIVSYFVRTASAYDTLLQMGRWFGYRFGYEDLPRVWMTDELKNAFRDLATVEQEIRNDVGRYQEEGLTPLQFAVRIRTHPTLAVTSQLKMQHAVPVGIDYAGVTRQTTMFHHRDPAWLNANWQAGSKLVETIRRDHSAFAHEGVHHYVRGVPAGAILKFIDEYQSHEDHTDLRREFLRKYIEKQNSQGRFQTWTVAAVTLARPDPTADRVKLGGLELAPVNRSKLQDRAPDGVDLGTITTQKNFSFDLPAEQQRPAPGATRRAQVKRPQNAEPLLLLVPIHKDSKPREEGSSTGAGSSGRRDRAHLDAADHILGLALAFPDSGKDRPPENYIQVQLPVTDSYVEDEDLVLSEDDG